MKQLFMNAKSLMMQVMVIALLLCMTGCATVPLTGRRQVMLVSDQEVLTSSLQQYNDYIQKSKLSSNRRDRMRVERVGRRIADATMQYLRQNGMANQLNNFAWEFNLVQSSQINAFCMPGGKIVVYEGLLKIAKTDDALAVVMGHEVAHALAKHSNERMSQQMLLQYGSNFLNLAVSKKTAAIQQKAGMVYGLGAQYGVMLPFSRTHEYEADKIGLILMAMAGYNPEAAVSFWQLMAQQGGQKPPEFMSTHPADANRVAKIRAFLPEAKKVYTRR